jgi:transcriptional regulator with XRE-family HTH domain
MVSLPSEVRVGLEDRLGVDMSRLSPEHAVYAVTILETLFKERELNQKWLEDHSGVPQSEISRILSRQKDPTKKELEALFEAMGIPLSEIISTVEALPDKPVGLRCDAADRLNEKPEK